MGNKLFIAGAALAFIFSTQPLQADVAAGKAAYDKACKSCHGPDGKGNAAIAKMMKVEMRPLGSKEVLAKSDADCMKNVTEGIGKMKPVKSLSEAEITSCVMFIRTLK